MKCHYCGEEVAENQNYCLWCGTRQEPVEVCVAEEPEQVELCVTEQPSAAVQPVLEERKPVQPEPEAELPVRHGGRYLPQLQLPTVRGLGKMIFLGLLTLGIYPTVIWSRIVTELNITTSRYDGRRTMPYFGMLMLAPLTLGIYAFVWMHKLCRRIGDELTRRGTGYEFGPSTFWLWNVLGSLIIVGPFVFRYKLMKSMNKINADFNTNG